MKIITADLPKKISEVSDLREIETCANELRDALKHVRDSAEHRQYRRQGSCTQKNLQGLLTGLR